MAVGSKLASWMAKKVKETPSKRDYSKDPRMDKREVKETVAMVEMPKLSRAELEELAKSTRSIRGQAAMDELERRGLKKYLKKTGKLDDPKENPEYDSPRGARNKGQRLSDALSASEVREDMAEREAKAKARGLAKGGMPTKKAPAKKPMPAKKPVAKKPAPKKK
jgi:hypothetical protein